jgi:hypothetical protein
MMHQCVFLFGRAFRLYPAKHCAMIDDKLRILESYEKGDEQ